MKKLIQIISFLLITSIYIHSQTITGRIVDQNGNGLPGLQLQLYINPNVYTTTSSSNGNFTFNNITGIKDEQIPYGYAVSNNFPNPFNPKTRIAVTLPRSCRIRINIYNLLGQKVTDEIEEYFSEGTKLVDIKLNGQPNGFYVATITLDEKYTIAKKLMLLYGSQHLSNNIAVPDISPSSKLYKSNLALLLDSLVIITSSGRRVFTNLPNMTESSLNLGVFSIVMPSPSTPTLESPPNGATRIAVNPTLSWYSSSGATRYTLQISADSTFSSYVYNQSELTNTSQQVVGLSNSIQYFWRVSATNDYGTSPYSTTWSFTTIGTAPSPPILASPENGSIGIATAPTLSWHAFTGATFTLQVSTANTFSSYVYNQSELINTHQQVSGLSNSTQYFWRVNATNKYGSSSWSDTWSFITTAGSCPGLPTVTYSGETYNTVQIGDQCWLRENLNVGIMIDGNLDQHRGYDIEKYCYNNDESNCTAYGGLYQWNEAMAYVTTEGARGICPEGWHIPTNSELQTLASAVNNDGNKLKREDQGTGTNESGFSALLAGYRSFEGYGFLDLGYSTNIWSSTTDLYDMMANYLGLGKNYSSIDLGASLNKGFGLSIRCLKD